jgi:two-component system response regulator DctR
MSAWRTSADPHQEELNAIGARIPIVFSSAPMRHLRRHQTIKAGAATRAEAVSRAAIADSINEALRCDAAPGRGRQQGEGFAERLRH